MILQWCRGGRACTLAALLCLCGALAATGCRESTSPPPPAAQKRPADKVYTARGSILMLPEPGRPTSQLVIHHEAIVDFENTDGTRGMASMEMPLPPASGVDLSGLAVDDAVEFDLAVWYRPENKGVRSVESFRVTRIRKLPPGTALDFGEATPTSGTPGPGGK